MPQRVGQTTSYKKIKNIQALRGIAALLVVLFHLLAIERKYGQGVRALPDFLILGASGVDFFLVISGVALVMTSRGGFQQVDLFLSLYFQPTGPDISPLLVLQLPRAFGVSF